jgi:hypothetical protein
MKCEDCELYNERHALGCTCTYVGANCDYCRDVEVKEKGEGITIEWKKSPAGGYNGLFHGMLVFFYNDKEEYQCLLPLFPCNFTTAPISFDQAKTKAESLLQEWLDRAELKKVDKDSVVIPRAIFELAKHMKDSDPRYSKIVDEHFWNLI